MELDGFKEHSPLCFAQQHTHHFSILNYGGRVDRDTYRFTCFAGLRFPEIEALLRPDTDDPTFPTIVTPIHMLKPDCTFSEWELSEDVNAVSVVRAAYAEAMDLAIPFFNRFSDLAAVEKNLRSDDARDWFALGPDQRVGVLAGIAMCDGRSDEAKRVIEHAIVDLKDANPGRLRRLQRLREQILGPTR
jgi:hypothetical protein